MRLHLKCRNYDVIISKPRWVLDSVPLDPESVPSIIKMPKQGTVMREIIIHRLVKASHGHDVQEVNDLDPFTKTFFFTPLISRSSKYYGIWALWNLKISKNIGISERESWRCDSQYDVVSHTLQVPQPTRVEGTKNTIVVYFINFY